MSTNADSDVFSEREQVRSAVLRALGEVRPVPCAEAAAFFGQRTNAGRKLPPSYLVHFTLIDLLGFPSLGKSEKVAWTVPIQFRDRVLVVEHRKMGLGVFSENAADDEDLAREVVNRIHKAVKAARPFFDWLASRAVAGSSINVRNHAPALFSRFDFLLRSYRANRDEESARGDEEIVREHQIERGARKVSDVMFASLILSVVWPHLQSARESRWLALAAVDAFFSWTEHIFVHLAILTGKATTGHEVTELAQADWPDKFKRVLDLAEPGMKKLFDELVEIRREMRNFMAHGAFGKDRRAFRFHSTAGAVPVVLPHHLGSRRYAIPSTTLSDDDATYFDDEATLAIIESFIEHLWSGDRSPARIYIQESGLDLILPRASDGTYASAMRSDDDMKCLLKKLHYQVDQAANMDW